MYTVVKDRDIINGVPDFCLSTYLKNGWSIAENKPLTTTNEAAEVEVVDDSKPVIRGKSKRKA